MPAYTTAAIVLRRLHYGETDNILTLYSPDKGRFSAIAKGARKAISRLSGATEALTCTRFGLATGKSLEIVTQVEVQESFSALRQDLTRLAHGLYLADLVDHAVEDHAPNPLLYEMLLVGLRQTQTLTPPELAARWFEVQLLGDLGYAPNLAECAVCRTPLPGDFARDELFALSASLGGALCPRHAHPESNEDHSGSRPGRPAAPANTGKRLARKARRHWPLFPLPGQRAWTKCASPCAAPCGFGWNGI